jgi:hypothetical protein
MTFLVPAAATMVGLGLALLLTRTAIEALLRWAYSGTSSAISAPSGVRSRTAFAPSLPTSV